MRAETREDRVAWVEALQAVKDMFPRISNSELMAPVDNVAISTEKLRLRLLEEGVSDAAIQDSEQIMRTEFAALQNQLVLLKQKQSILIDTMRNLEVLLLRLYMTSLLFTAENQNVNGFSVVLDKDMFTLYFLSHEK